MAGRFGLANAAPDVIGRIRALLQGDDNISFAELRQLDGFPGKFSYEIADPPAANIVLWIGVSEEAIDALNELASVGEIHFWPTSPLVYLCDGALLKLPVARGVRRYAKPHWLPAMVRRGPAPPAPRQARARRR